MTHYWRVRKYLPARFRQPCRLLARALVVADQRRPRKRWSANSVLVGFADGYRVVTSAWFIRRLVP